MIPGMMAERQLANLVDMDSPEAVLDEVLTIASTAFFPATVSSGIGVGILRSGGVIPGELARGPRPATRIITT
jgi:hypothetical protein